MPVPQGYEGRRENGSGLKVHGRVLRLIGAEGRGETKEVKGKSTRITISSLSSAWRYTPVLTSLSVSNATQLSCNITQAD